MSNGVVCGELPIAEVDTSTTSSGPVVSVQQLLSGEIPTCAEGRDTTLPVATHV